MTSLDVSCISSTAMTLPRQPHTELNFHYDSASHASPLTPRCRDVIPVGTVVSRIMELQNLATSSKSNGLCSPATQRLEKSQTGFGRRSEPRFGKPAWRSSKPDKDKHLDTKHSFLGLNTHRVNHLEEHALVDGRAKWDRTHGLHGRLHSSGLGARVQHEATSQWSILPKGKSGRTSQRDNNYQDVDTFVNSSTENQLSSMALLMPPLSNPPCCSEGDEGFIQGSFIATTPQKSSRQASADLQKASSTWLSFKTTSTMRHQSVKDLYYYSGIQKPIGLISSETITFNPERTPRPLAKAKCIRCLACTSVNSHDVLNCKFGHSSCEASASLPSKAVSTSDGSFQCVDCVPKREFELLKESKAIELSVDCEVSKQDHAEQLKRTPQPKQESTQEQVHRQKISKMHEPYSGGQMNNIPVTSSVLCFEEALPGQGPQRARRGHAKLPDSSNSFRWSTMASDISTSIREPLIPFADALSSASRSTLPLAGMQVSQDDDQNLLHGCHGRPEGSELRSSCSSPSSNLERGSGSSSCDSSSCRATHQGYQPYRHSITCTRKRRRYSGETDSGYIASASHLEEHELPQQQANLDFRNENERNDHNEPAKQYLSPCENESNLPRRKVITFGNCQLSHQTSYEKTKASLQSNVDLEGGVQYKQDQYYGRGHEAQLFNRAAASLPDNFQFNGALARDSGHYSTLDTSDHSGNCQHSMGEDQNQICRVSHIHNEFAEAHRQFSPRSEISSVTSLELKPISSQPSSMTLSELISSSPVAQLVNAGSALKSHVEMKSPHCLTGKIASPSLNTNEQETSSIRNNQFRAEVRKISIDESKQADPLEAPLQSNRNGHQSRSRHSGDNSTKANRQKLRNNIAIVPTTAVEECHSERPASSCPDLIADSALSMPIQQSADLSPRNFQPASRRLPAFFKLQEQNTISLVSKRLRQYQDELKRIERIPDHETSARVQEVSVMEEPDQQTNCLEHKVEPELAEANMENMRENDLSRSSFQLGERAGMLEGLGKGWKKEIQSISSGLGHRDIREVQEEEHDCARERVVMSDRERNSRKQILSVAQASTEGGGDKICDIGIKSITIVIHLKGREDVMIKADLSEEV